MNRTNESSNGIVHEIFDLLSFHCTSGESGRERFIERCNAVLSETALNPTDSASATWARSWDKPLYANQKAQRATEVAQRIRQTTGLFEDPVRIPQTAECLAGLRAPGVKLERVRELGRRWEEVHHLHQQIATTATSLLKTGDTFGAAHKTRFLLGVPGYRNKETRDTLFDLLTSICGIGPITSLHLMTDLGYPVYKPDRWVVRFAAADETCRRTLEVQLPPGYQERQKNVAYLLRHLDLVCASVDLLTSDFLKFPPPKGIRITERDFRVYRFVDLMVAKFGMAPEASFGLVVSGKDFLLKASPAERAQYPRLIEVAEDMDRSR